MRGYELTERGKIFVAILLVFFLLLVPSAIMLYSAMSGEAVPAEGNEPQSAGVPPLSSNGEPVQTGTKPPPNGGGFYPPEAVPPNGGDAGDKTPRPTGVGHPCLGDDGDGLSFYFSPNFQNTVDAETSSVLGIFLSSPKNDPNVQILIEIPELSDGDAKKTKSAIISAFAAQGVREQRLCFIVNDGEAGNDPFEIYMSFSAYSYQ